MATFTGTSGADSFSGTIDDDLFNLKQGGDDNATGDDGSDVFQLGAAFTANDAFDGGSGNDVLKLAGDYSAGLTFLATTLVGVETISLKKGHTYNFTTNDATVAAGATLVVKASTLHAADALLFDGSAETDGMFSLRAGQGNDVLIGGVRGDSFNLSKGGDDTAYGGAGKDAFQLGGKFTAADTIDGGINTDKMVLDGNYANANAVVFGATTLTNVETMLLSAGHSYTLTTHEATVAAGAMLTVDASALVFPNTLIFNGAAETDGFFHIIGGTGNDTVNMGAGLKNGDLIDGGAGLADLLVLDGDYSSGFTFTSSVVTGIEMLTLTAGHSYDLTFASGSIGGTLFTLGAGTLGTGDSLLFDGSATSALLFVTGGEGDDVLEGGSGENDFVFYGGNDTAYGGGGVSTYSFFNNGSFTAADRIYGTLSGDKVRLQGDYSGGVTLAPTTLVNVDFMLFLPGGQYNITSDDATVASGMAFIVDGFVSGAGVGFTFNGGAETDGTFQFIGGTANDTITGGAQADTFDLTHGGSDSANGGGGNDSFDFAAALSNGDTVDGGGGTDTVTLNGDYSAGVVAALSNIETLTLAGGHTYKLTMGDGVAAGQTMTVTANGAVYFDGSAETDGKFNIACATSGNTLIGGAGNDTFTMSNPAGNDTIVGGGGADTFNRSTFFGTKTYVYNAVSDSTGPAYDHLFIVDFNNGDNFKVSGMGAVTGLDTQVSVGALSTATFDTDLAAAVGASQLAGHHAVYFQPDSGYLAHRLFLVIDENGTTGYQGGGDLVIWLQVVAGSISLANFT